jgi:hypothetical protein
MPNAALLAKNIVARENATSSVVQKSLVFIKMAVLLKVIAVQQDQMTLIHSCFFLSMSMVME